MPVIDPAAIMGILADLGVSMLSYAGIAAILYSIGEILIRTLSWMFDRTLINFIAFFYKYFEMIIDGTLLTDTTVNGMISRVYLIVGVIVVFRLGMLLFSYMINPSEAMDEKIGVNSLIKRVILGLMLIILMPTIFNFAFQLQDAILDDQVIERIIMPEDDMEKVKKYSEEHGVGKIIGMTIFRGFFDLSDAGKSSSKAKKNFEKATDIEEDYDLSVIDDLSMSGPMNSGIMSKDGDKYIHNYFPIFSTVILIYVLYLLVQYCLDAVVRSFKLSILQVIAPIAVVEYMVNGDKNEVFKSWKKATISTFAMLFLRVASIWFVAYVTMLMQPGMTASTSLLQTGDNLLKAVIVLGLLAFMMDFPKMMSDVFGLDLDQSGSVKNVMGKAMGAATAGLAIGGAVAGFGMKAAGGVKGTLKGGLTNLAGKNSSFAKGLNNPFKTLAGQGAALAGNTVAGIGALGQKLTKKGSNLKDNYAGIKSGMDQTISKAKQSKVAQEAAQIGASFADAAKANHLGSTLKTGALAVGGALLASNQLTKGAAGGYQQTTGAIDSKNKGQEEQKANAAMQQNISAMANSMEFEATVNLAARLRASGVDLADLPNAVVDAQINANSNIPNMVANVSGILDSLGGAGGSVTSSQAEQVITTALGDAGVSQSTIVEIKNDIQSTYASGGSISSADAQSLIEDAYRREYTPQAEEASRLVP